MREDKQRPSSIGEIIETFADDSILLKSRRRRVQHRQEAEQCMLRSNSESNNSNSHDRRSTDDQAPVSREEFKQLKQTVESLQSDKEQLEGRVTELESDKRDLQNQLDQKDSQIEELQEQLNDERDKRSADLEGCHSRINELKQDIDGVNPTPQADETTLQASDLTPIEQLSQSHDVSDVTDSPTVERAVSLFKNLNHWGSKTPKGIVLKPADNPLSLLEADRDESLAWKQYYRAAEVLEQLSQGSVTFFDSDRHGKMICLHKQSEAFERVVNGTLTPSSEGETT